MESNEFIEKYENDLKENKESFDGINLKLEEANSKISEFSEQINSLLELGEALSAEILSLKEASESDDEDEEEGDKKTKKESEDEEDDDESKKDVKSSEATDKKDDEADDTKTKEEPKDPSVKTVNSAVIEEPDNEDKDKKKDDKKESFKINSSEDYKNLFD